MIDFSTERRRSPRVAPPPQLDVAIHVSRVVQVLDISVAGVLLSTAGPLPIGQRGSLRTTLGTHPFAAEIEVKRAGAEQRERGDGVSGGRMRLGAAFVDLDESSRRSVDRFLKMEA